VWWVFNSLIVSKADDTNVLCYQKNEIFLSGVWEHDNCTAVIAVPGIYYTVVTMGESCGNASFWLTVNGEKVYEVRASNSGKFSFVFVESVNNNGHPHDNGAVIRLAAGDSVAVHSSGPQLKMRYCFTYNYESNQDSRDVDASFFGMLLSPDIVS
jgi:hypothetical protein